MILIPWGIESETQPETPSIRRNHWRNYYVSFSVQIKQLYVIYLRRNIRTASDMVHDIQRQNRPSVKGARYKFGVLQDPCWEVDNNFIITLYGTWKSTTILRTARH